MPIPPAAGDSAQPFTLDDQYQQPHEVAFGGGAAVVLVFADRTCANDVEPWARALSTGLGGRARVVGVAAIGTVPSLFHGAVRGFLQGKPGVLLDWGNQVSHAFGYEGAECLVVAVDARGAVRARMGGALSDARYAEIAAVISGDVLPERE